MERKHSTSPIYCKIQLTKELEILVKGETKFYNLKDLQKRIPNKD